MLNTSDGASVGGSEEVESVARILKDINSAMDTVTAKMNNST